MTKKKTKFNEEGFNVMMRPLKKKMDAHGIEADDILVAEKMIRDLTELNEEAGIEVIDAVEAFFDEEVPEPSESPVVNATVMAVMSVLLKMSEKEIYELIKQM